MKNSVFELQFNREKALLTSLVLTGDPERANLIKTDKGLCEICPTL